MSRTLEDRLAEARAERDRIEEMWANYNGNNPNKYISARRMAREAVARLEREIKRLEDQA